MKKKYCISLSILLLIGCQPTKEQSNECVEKDAPEDYICAQIYQPVCGCNDKTYSNECEANAKGITVVSQGECPSK